MIVKKYIKAKNDYDFGKMKQYLDSDYYETFLNNYTFESQTMQELKELTDWCEVMHATTILKNIDQKNDEVVTIEQYSNLMDTIINRRPKVFKVTYFVESNKIVYSKIDSLNGFSKLSLDKAPEILEFYKYVFKHNPKFQDSGTKEGALELKKALLDYKELHEK